MMKPDLVVNLVGSSEGFGPPHIKVINSKLRRFRGSSRPFGLAQGLCRGSRQGWCTIPTSCVEVLPTYIAAMLMDSSPIGRR